MNAQPPLPLLKSYLIKKRSPLTGQERTLLLWMREDQWREIQPFLTGNGPGITRLIEAILPDHSPDEHEFVMNGTTVAERRACAC